jgi:hypothetical protein
LASAAQRAEVVRLRDGGWSIRAIAAEVFGDRRFRGRVERILAGRPVRVSRAVLDAEAAHGQRRRRA